MLQSALSGSRGATWRAILLTSALALAPACDNDSVAPDPNAPANGTVSGVVVSSTSGDPVAGAEVSIGQAKATTGTDGRFQLTSLTAGPATLRCVATGFEVFEANVTVPSGKIYQAISLQRIDLVEFGDFALYAPDGGVYAPGRGDSLRAIILALGGPDTRAFASGGPFGAPVPQVEASLQALGESLRSLTGHHRLAILGTSLSALENAPESDRLLLDAVREAAALSGRPELESIPLLLYGMSGGAPQAAGFTARHPERVAGLFLKVPAGVEPLTSPDALGVPTYMVLAELDAFVDNAALQAAFEVNRSTGALWALALEPGVPHHSVTPPHRELTINWMRETVGLRLGQAATDPLRAVGDSDGWIGDHATGEVTSRASHSGNDAGTSWLPSELTVEEWRAFGGAGGLPPFSLHVEPEALTVAVGEAVMLTARVLDPDGNKVVNPDVHFSSDREDVAQVWRGEPCDWDCPNRRWRAQVVGVTEGEAQITAQYGRARTTVRVTVSPSGS